MRHISFVLVLLSLLFDAHALSAQKVKVYHDEGSSAVLSMMTYNIRHGKGMDGNVDLKRIAKEIALVAPDVVALQEVDNNTGRSGKVNTAAEIATLTELGYKSFFGKAMDYDGGEFGNAILSKSEPIAKAVIPLSGADEPRSLLVLEFPDFYFATCHLSLDAESRMASCYTIHSAVKDIASGKYKENGAKVFSGKDKPFYLTGDFNATPESTDIFVIAKAFYWLSKTESFSFPSDKPNRLLDYIFLYKNKAGQKLMKDFEARKKGLASWIQPEDMASDHRPVFCTIINGDKFVEEDISEDE